MPQEREDAQLLRERRTRRQDLGQQLLVLVTVRVRRELLTRLDVTQRAAPEDASKQS